MRNLSLVVVAAVFVGCFSWTAVTYGSGPGWKVWPWWDQAALAAQVILFIVLAVRKYSKGA